ncbi:MAG: glycosyltransferase family 4 protein [Pyrinomonadaceae bacterium]
MEPPKRIRFVWNYLDWGGANVYLLAIMKEAAAKWDMKVLLPIGSSQDILELITAVGVPYRLIDAALDKAPARSIARKLQRQWRRIRAEAVTYKELKNEGLKDLVVHCELAAWQSWIFYWLLCRRGANVFFTMHNALPDQPRWRNIVWRFRIRFLSKRRGFHLFASNQHAKDSLHGWVDPQFWESMPVTYTCVDPDEISAALASHYDANWARTRFGMSEDAFVVLTVGQFIDRKGRWTLLEAAKQIAFTNDRISFVWVTPELPSDEDQRRIESYGLGVRFRLILSSELGGSRMDVLRFYRTADVFTLPSFVEGLPIALLEAMAMGLPVVSANVYGIPEAIEEGVTGMMIEAGDSEALASKIQELYGDGDLRAVLGKRASAFVLSHFDERVAARTALSHYEKALND